MVKGQRYIIGAFILIQDKVEHVRRLNIQVGGDVGFKSRCGWKWCSGGKGGGKRKTGEIRLMMYPHNLC